MTLEDLAKLIAVAGSVQIVVNGAFTAGRNVEIRPAFEMAADQFSIFVLGSDEDGGPAASIGEHSAIRALLATRTG